MDDDEFLRSLRESVKQHAALLEAMANAPLTKVEGVVTPSALGLTKLMGQKMWQLRLSLSPWRQVGGELRHDKLTINQELDDGESKLALDGLDACSVVTMEVRLDLDNLSGTPQALLVKKYPPTSYDENLTGAAEALLRPKEFWDAQFGKFTLNRQLGWYSATSVWDREEVSLHLEIGSVDDDAFPQRALECARAFWQNQEKWSPKLSARVVDDLLELKNTIWLAEDESPLSEEAFLGSIVVQSISLDSEGQFSFCYSDGELFEGHSIRVWGNFKEGVKRASLEG